MIDDRIVRFRIVRYGGPISGAANARGTWSRREGLLLELRSHGFVGVGEASPLPGYSPDSLVSAEQALQEALERPLSALTADEPILPQLRSALARLPEGERAARFALESALLDLLGHQHRRPVWRMLREARGLEPAPAFIPASTLVDLESSDMVAQAAATVERGVRTLKLKVGRPGAFGWELERLEALRRAVGPGVRLRLDANGMLPSAGIRACIEALATVDPELIEEPVAWSDWQTVMPSPVPFALDESLQSPDVVAQALEWLDASPGAAGSQLAAVVLKPMALGGTLRCLEIADAFAARGVPAIVTHSFDGPIAWAGAASLALALRRVLPCGLAAHVGLEAWPRAENPLLAPCGIVAAEVEGLGCRLHRSPVGEGKALSVRAAAAECPRQSALVVDGHTLDYAALAAEVQVALGWLEQHVPAGDADQPVALVAGVERDTLVMVLALIERGTPALLLHPRWTRHEWAQVLDMCLPSLLIPSDWRAGSSAAPSTVASGLVPDSRSLAVLCTSGTTGIPKGVALSRGAFLASARASEANLGWRDDDRWLLCLPVAHVGGLSILVRCLAARRCVVVAPGRLETEALAHTIARERVTLVSLVPTQLQRLLALEPRWEPPSHLRAILLGGAAASPVLLEQAVARGCKVLTTYGLTEACSQVATQPYGTVNRGAMGVGQPIAGLELRIEDGVIEVRGPQLMTGYYPADRWPSPFQPGGWFRTGDLGALDARGNLHIFARRTDLIVTGGENVYPVEIEQVLEQCPGISEACVFGVADGEWGQLVAACLVAGPGGPPSDNKLDSYLRARLAPFKRPRRVCYVDALPLNATGKVDRLAAREAASPGLRTLEV